MRAAIFRQTHEEGAEMDDFLPPASDVEVPEFNVKLDQPTRTHAAVLAAASLADQAELAVVGAILFDNALYDVAIDQLGKDAFQNTVAKPVFAAIGDIIEGRVEGTTVAEAFTVAARPGVQGVVSLAQLEKLEIDSETEPEKFLGRVQVIKQATLRRGIDSTLEKAQTVSADSSKTPEEIQAEIAKLLEGVSEMKTLPVVSMASAAKKALAAMVERADKGLSGIGITTGFPDLDALTAGYGAGQLIVVAARPGVGKTALAMASAIAAGGEGKHVVIASMEMVAEELSKRAMSTISGVDSHDIRMGSLAESDWESLVSAIETMESLPLEIVDMDSLTVSALGGLARRLKREGKLDLLIVDYLQIMETTDSPGTNRQEHIAYLSRSLKKLAMILRIPVIALSQLKRPMPGHESKPPQLTDLRESGAIEQDSDLVILLHRPDDSEEADAIVEKQRAGAKGVVPLRFEKSTTSFFPANTYRPVISANDPLRHAA